MPIRKVVVGIIFYKEKDETQFLVLNRILLWKGWEFPKGGIEPTDRAEELALKREIQEETGLTNVRVLVKLPYQIKYPYTKKYGDKFKYTETVQNVYLVRAFQKDVTTTIEHKGFKWLGYNDARKLLTHTQQKKALDIAWKNLRGKSSEEGNVTF